jgi:ribosomal protein S6
MKKQYELVCVIDARLSMEDIRVQMKAVEKLVGDAKVDTDDMGLLPLAYPLKGQTQAYFVSYALSIDTDLLNELKHNLSLEKGVIKYHIFSLKSTDAFLKYADLKKAYAALLPAEKEELEEEEEESVEEVAVV